ncbi:MAG TPA: helix-turn-helix domain-containing protein [Trinickia sp.]|nr:helix-turn-helix domain-containing protein [Trinickia sp.]
MAKRIAILVFDGFSLVEASTIAEVFRLADEIEGERMRVAPAPPAHTDAGTDAPNPAGPPPVQHPPPPARELPEPYTLIVVSGTGGSIASSATMRVWSDNLDAYASTGLHALFIPGGSGAARVSTDESFVRRLCALMQRTRLVKAIGEGGAIAAAAAASNGDSNASAATPAAHEMPSAPAAPGAPAASAASATSAPSATSAMPALVAALAASGAAPGKTPVEHAVALDDPLGPIAAALSIVKRDRGAQAAREIAERSTPGAWRRLGAVLGELDEGGTREKIDTAARWIRENYGQPISVAKAAEVAAMSERSFLRRFKSQIGITPSEYLLRARLDASCLLLVATDLPVDKIARRCGVGSGDGLAKMFRKRLSISPTEYRVAERRRARQR